VSAKITVLPEARDQLGEADDWWRTHREKAPHLFAEEWAGALGVLALQPDAGRLFPLPHHRRLRVLLMPKTRYHIYYEHDASEGMVLVLGLWSAVRGRPPSLRRTKA
jgi:plasmid stabilization system protein ParE